MGRISDFLAAEDGATAIEYGLIAALIATAIISGMNSYSNAMSNMFNYLGTTMQNANH